MPKSAGDLNKLNQKLSKKLDAEPTYMMDVEGKQYELSFNEREIIESRWIDKVELFKATNLEEEYVGGKSNVVVMVSLKQRKLDDFFKAIEERDIQLLSSNKSLSLSSF
ncbi:hypothetical protein PZB74_12060 [Porifericola rhodea]|uniref:hypothetical protein n=1 Tax=Porifericola rhodea TaxID=930972 RepID=UPI002665B286|nr:hypothetical protein [Porifericola rhodea]WKN29701.1 hypothetical protein PZB74_12060 [Porifericola rhodea]